MSHVYILLNLSIWKPNTFFECRVLTLNLLGELTASPDVRQYCDTEPLTMGVQRVLLFVLLGCLLTLLLASTSTPSQSADGSASSPLPEAVKGSAETAETTENATELHAGDGAFNGALPSSFQRPHLTRMNELSSVQSASQGVRHPPLADKEASSIELSEWRNG